MEMGPSFDTARRVALEEVEKHTRTVVFCQHRSLTAPGGYVDYYGGP